MNSVPTLQDEACPEMDGLLHDYFQSEMPKAWPSFKAPRDVQAKTGSFWARYSGRAILAGSVALLVAAYLMLGGMFPAPQSQTGLNEVTRPLGMKEKGQTPHTQNDDDLPRPIGNANRK